jgi:hypothetical protein
MKSLLLIMIGGLLFFSNRSLSQIPSYIDTSAPHKLVLFHSGYRTAYLLDDSLIIITGICKNYTVVILKKDYTTVSVINPVSAQTHKTPFITLHGNIQYEYIYRSFVDTPFVQHDMSQHYVQTNLYITVKDKYPLKLSFQSRRSNSPYFANIFDANIQFSRQLFIEKYKLDLKQKALASIDWSRLFGLEERYKTKLNEVKELQAWVNSPKRDQDIIAEREKQLRKNAGFNDTLGLIHFAQSEFIVKDTDSAAKLKPSLANSDSLSLGYAAYFAEREKQLNQKKSELHDAEQKIINEKKSISKEKDNINKEARALSDPASLKAFVKKYNIDGKDLPKGYKTIALIKNIGLGRNWVDQSELTVKNISITGATLELTPSPFYFSISAGKINYRYRDFIVKNYNGTKQSLFTTRIGYGSKDENNVILTYYNGKRNILNPYGLVGADQKAEQVEGISLENQWKLNEQTKVILEVAKSSVPTYRRRINSSEKTLDFSSRSNEAYSIKVQSNIPVSNTKFIGYYRKTGADFQSFNLFPINVDQESWMVKFTQKLQKDRLTIDAGLRKNDFNSPYTNTGINSKVIFKTLQISYRKPKYPFISFGYYPSTQLTFIDNDKLVENQYNTINGIVSHSYRVENVPMNTNVVYVRFYNSGSDTGFIYYNAQSMNVNHHIFLKRFSIQTGLGITEQTDLNLLTLEQAVNWQLKDFLILNGGLKWNRLDQFESLWGCSAGMGISFKKFGVIQLNYEKNFLPGLNKNLVPVTFGRMSYSRVF